MAPVFQSLPLLLILANTATPPSGVTGVVRSTDSGLPLHGVLVVLGDRERLTYTDSAGRYLISAVAPGPQRLTIRYLGHVPQAVTVLVPREGALVLDVGLEPLPERLPIVAVVDVAVVATAAADANALDPLLTATDLAHHPMSGDRDLFSALAHGVASARAETPGGLYIRGGGSEQTGYRVDGVPVFNPYHLGGLMSAWNPDVIAAAGLSRRVDADVLSGVVDVTTRAPGARLTSRGGLSSSGLRLAADGPLGRNSGFLASARASDPGLLSPGDATYLRGRTSDWLLKAEHRASWGVTRLLATGSDDALTAAASPTPTDQAEPTDVRHEFGWSNRSLGASWEQRRGPVRLQGNAWASSAEAHALLGGARGVTSQVSSSRVDVGVQALVEQVTADLTWRALARVERGQTAYRSEVAYSVGDSAAAFGAVTPVMTLSGELSRRIGNRLSVGAQLAAHEWNARAWLAPGAQLAWRFTPRWKLEARARRQQQFVQSLRNPQSVVGHIFPADLFLGAGAGGVPVVIGDELSLKARGPLAGWAVGVEAWTRSTSGQVLVAPFEAGPFARGRFGEGSGQARGVTLDAERSAARAIVLASYAWQAVSARYDGGSYAPEHGARHQASLGLTLLPSPSTSIRLSALGAAGRRSSAADGALEWEACNLWDRGCEFAGAPDADPTRVGARRLPPYLRVDLSARRVLTRRILARDGEVAVFGTLSNLLNRRNVLTYADAAQGSRPLEMRPRAPVVIGLEWVF